MASVLEPEVQLAQRLASNEKPVRTRAVKKLRKYISVRSQGESGGFSPDELLKLWKGLFYCVWMQDKPQLQEELSNKISKLIHSFQGTDGQLQYLESFLQTLKREWTGIDRLRMDKFLQLVRFMFRQTFETLERKDWENSAVGRFLEVLSLQLLKSDAQAPIGLQLHVLDVYMTELAAVGSAQLTADQNLTFIDPFCKTAAKTKNRTLFRGICSSIFSAIIDQAPFAIEELMKEVEAMDSDSGRASEDDDQPDGEKKKKTASRASNGKTGKKQLNGKTPHEEEDDDDDDDELLDPEDSDTEPLHDDDEDVGPVLQFDYAALADRLFGLASRASTPGQNRQSLYKIIKALRDLSEGIVAAGDESEEVSTDEDDDMFCSRRRMKRRRQTEDGDAPTGKKRKANAGKKENQSSEAADENKKKKKKKKRKAEGNPEDQGQTESTHVEEEKPQISSSVDEPAAAEPVGVTAEEPKKKKKKRRRKKKKNMADSEPEVSADGDAAVTEEPSVEPEEEAPPTSKKKKKSLGADEVPAAERDPAGGEEEASACNHGDGAPAAMQPADQEDVSAPTPMKTRKKKKKEEEEAGQAEIVMATPTKMMKKKKKNSAAQPEEAGEETPSSGKPQKKKKRKIPVEFEFEADELADETPTQPEEDASEPSIPLSSRTFQKKKKKGGGSDFVSFQSKAVVPTPLFCRTRGGPAASVHSRKKNQTPKSDLKKVTFGLKNNKTAEFRRTDRSLLLSPDGSSRVPFDPEQKPKFGVLKSPPTVLKKKKKTAAGTKKTGLVRQNSLSKRRPLAADFF